MMLLRHSRHCYFSAESCWQERSFSYGLERREEHLQLVNRFRLLTLQPLVNAESAPTTESLSGKVVVLHFWGTWCPPCRREFPEFVELAKKFGDEPRVAIVSVSCSGGPEYKLDELRSETEAYLSDVAPGMQTFADPAAMTRTQLAMLLSGGTFGYPTTVLAGSRWQNRDRAGRIS